MNGVSFKGLYVLTGRPENARTKYGKTIHDLRSITLESFLEDTKPYRSENGNSYYNKKTGDYYMSVKPQCEADFEDEVYSYKLDCVKVGDDVLPNKANVKEEMSALEKIRYGLSHLYRLNQQNNIFKKGNEKITEPSIKKNISNSSYDSSIISQKNRPL